MDFIFFCFKSHLLDEIRDYTRFRSTPTLLNGLLESMKLWFSMEKSNIFEHIWLHFGPNLDGISRIFMDFSEIVLSSTCSFSMTTGRISKSFFIKHIYSTRYVDCAVFRVVWGTPGGRLEPMNSSTKPVFDSEIPTKESTLPFDFRAQLERYVTYFGRVDLLKWNRLWSFFKQSYNIVTFFLPRSPGGPHGGIDFSRTGKVFQSHWMHL